MELVYAFKHLGDVEARVLLLENARVVEKGSKVAAGYVFHSEIDELRVLERVQKPDEPRGFGGGKDVALDQNVADLR